MFTFVANFNDMTYEKLLYSDEAQTKGVKNTPSNVNIVRNLQQLQDVLSAMETILGVEIIVNSGFRTPELNFLVGGVEKSYHMIGLAADIRVENTARCTLTDLKNLCKELRKTRLLEAKEYETYVHIAIKRYF